MNTESVENALRLALTTRCGCEGVQRSSARCAEARIATAFSAATAALCAANAECVALEALGSWGASTEDVSSTEHSLGGQLPRHEAEHQECPCPWPLQRARPFGQSRFIALRSTAERCQVYLTPSIRLRLLGPTD